MRTRIVPFSEIAADPTHRLDAEHYIEGTPTMSNPKAYKDMTTAERDLIDCLWPYLERVPGHCDRRQTGYGSKTRWGLVLTVRRMGRAVEDETAKEFEA